MAQIITYPKLSTLANNDLLLVSDISSANKTTNSLEVDTLAQHIITTNNVVTGGGTLRQIPMFNPTGVTISDSVMRQSFGPTKITIDGSLDVAVNLHSFNDSSVAGTFYANDMFVYGGAQFHAGLGVVSGQVTIQSTASQFLCQTTSYLVKDVNIVPLFGLPNPTLTVYGDIKVSNVGRVKDMLDPVDPQDAATKAYVDASAAGGVSGTGTTNTIPVWSDGPNGVLGDSVMAEKAGGELVITTSTSVGATNIVTHVAGFESMAIGSNNTVLQNNGLASGNQCTSNAFVAFAGGGASQANGIAAIAYGNNAQANGVNSVAFGSFGTASGDYSFAVGDVTTASGENSMALGGDALAKDSLAGPGVTVNTPGYAGFQKLLLANYASLNYTSDAAAAAGGVPLGGIYHNAGDVKIRLV